MADVIYIVSPDKFPIFRYFLHICSNTKRKTFCQDPSVMSFAVKEKESIAMLANMLTNSKYHAKIQQ